VASIYLINPRALTPGYFGAEVLGAWGKAPAQGIGDLGTVTAAAFVPAHWSIAICEEHAETVDFDHDADFIGITGYVSQCERMRAIADEFRQRGKTVIIGGPQASLDPGSMRDHCDVLVVGELEDIAGELFADLERGTWRDMYTADEPDLTTSPLPRWDLYPNHRTLVGCVQTSRGCPFECEFCDVIQYLGRKQRHKNVDQILAELDQLYALGYGAVFLADDNFTVYRKRAKAVLTALRDWNRRQPDGPMALSTQVSIDAARDPEIMQLCAEAGITWVFIGIETPNEASLRETKKRQNVGVDLVREVQVFLEHGISVAAGMIAGFDHDGPEIFDRLYDFAQASAIPFLSLGALNAPASTPLHSRMAAEGRLLANADEMTSSPWETNIVPAGMSRAELLEGLREVCNRIYQPAAFGQRVVDMIERLGPQRGPFSRGFTQRKPRAVEREGLQVVRKVLALGAEERAMWRRIAEAIGSKPEAGPMAMMMLFRYAQVRCLYETDDFWIAEQPARDPLVQIGSR